ncbi:MAG: Proteasome subunit beta type-4 [Alyxoria varia]|nr:MAG: Proteasome subunit beta type-4 [Alyxoria varia]
MSSTMDILIGLTGKDFCIIAASKAANRGPTILKATDDKTQQLSDHCTMAYSGEAGDTVQFAEFIQANISLYTTRNSHTLQPPAIASFTRNELARALRSRNPYTVNLLLGGISLPSSQTSPFGFPPAAGTGVTSTSAPSQQPEPRPEQEVLDAESEKPKPKLYWLDYLATCAEVPYACHGYAQYYCLSLLDKHHHPDISLEQGMKLLRMCADELRRRLPIDYKGLEVKVVTEKGVERMDFQDDPTIMPV